MFDFSNSFQMTNYNEFDKKRIIDVEKLSLMRKYFASPLGITLRPQ